LEPDLAGLNPVVKRAVEPDKGLSLHVAEIDRIGGCCRIVALLREFVDFGLERAGALDVRPHAQEHRPRVGRQGVCKVPPQCGKVEWIICNDGGHAGGALGARHLDPVSDGFSDPRECRERIGHLGCGDVLAFPAEGVADPVDKIEEAVGVAAQQVSGAIPDVAALEHVAENLLLRRFAVGITFEFASARCGAADSAERLAYLAGRAADA
jgi:hypothetical protein